MKCIVVNCNSSDKKAGRKISFHSVIIRSRDTKEDDDVDYLEDIVNPDTEDESLKYFEDDDMPINFLEEAQVTHTSNTPNTLRSRSSKRVDALLKYKEAACFMAYQIVKHKKSFGDARTWTETFVKILNTFGNCDVAQKLMKIPFTRFTIGKCVDILNARAEEELMAKIQRAEVISIALDETTDVSHSSQLLIFVRGVFSDMTIFEEMLELKQLKTTGKGQDILRETLQALGKFGATDKLFSVTTDGAPAMKGNKEGFYGLLCRQVPHVKHVYCMLHQENLCARNLGLKLNATADFAVQIINKIRGGNRSLTHRLFKQFLLQHGAPYKDLLMSCEVRWLTKCNALKRLFVLRQYVMDFVETIKFDESLKEKMKSSCFWPEIALLCDVMGCLNKLNISMQGNNHDVFHHLRIMDELIDELKMMEEQILSNDLRAFPTCHHLRYTYSKYSENLRVLIQNLEMKFRQYQDLRIYNPEDVVERRNLLSIFPTTY
uniref:Uncharacterized protein n=1 Tax=Phlebotomus papatasi TaxID=29031 RepID=A0A1B0CZS1_PHLPP